MPPAVIIGAVVAGAIVVSQVFRPPPMPAISLPPMPAGPAAGAGAAARDDPGRLITTSNVRHPVPLIYGKTRVGGNRVFATTTGVDNKFLHMIIALGEGELNGIAKITGVDQIFLDGILHTKTDFAHLFHYEFFNGSATQGVCATLHAAYPAWTDTLRHTAYLYVRFEYDREKFNAIPDITVVLEGLRVRDFRTESVHANMPLVYTNNIALCVYDLFTRPSTRGGKGINPNRIDLGSFRDAALYYTKYGWTCNMPVFRDQAVGDNLASLLVNGRSEIVYSNNKFKLKFRDIREETVVLQLGEDDIIQSGKESTIHIAPVSDLFSRPNAIKASFFSETKNYHQDEWVFLDNAAQGVEGDYRELRAELFGLSSLSHVIPMSYYYLERARWGSVVTLTASNRALVLEPMDLVRITHRMPGWTDVTRPLFRVIDTQVQEDGNVSLTLLQETLALYDHAYGMSPSETFITDLLSPTAPVQPVTNISLTEEIYFYRGRSFTRLKVSFIPPLREQYPFWDYAEVWVKIGADPYKFMTKASGDYILDPVEEGKIYTIKFVSVSIFGMKEGFHAAPAVSRTVFGKTVAPTNMTAITAVAAGDTVSVYGTMVPDPDIVGYELRIGSGWEGGIFVAFNETPNFRLSGMRPGTHTLWCAPKGNNGLYGTVPVSAPATVFYPANYIDRNVWSWDYSTGVHSNTQRILQGGVAHLQCAQVGGVLTGTWTSPEYDLGIFRTVRVWGDFLTTFLGAATHWNSVFAPIVTTRWMDKAPQPTRWVDLFPHAAAGKLEARIEWGSSSGVYTNHADYFQILAPEFSARFLRVRVTITDPHGGSHLLVRLLNMRAAYWQ